MLLYYCSIVLFYTDESGLKHYAKLRSPALFTLQLCQLCLPYNTNYAKLIIFFFLFSGGFLPGGRVRAPSKIPKINDSELDERTIDSREMLLETALSFAAFIIDRRRIDFETKKEAGKQSPPLLCAVIITRCHYHWPPLNNHHHPRRIRSPPPHLWFAFSTSPIDLQNHHRIPLCS
ncbi:unnamed protein product [Lactuca virosa]|uniref:Uncharacterized protein n=1 Tax=Lactuca virosa TaxID=75947 RepID=A0AAU9MK74_9ASTR|nr:unnamed protein product [Lactuca virosa]